MTVLDMSRTVDVEADGRVLHGVAIPYERPSLVADRGRDGNVRVYAETWDDASMQLPAGPIPLLVSHDETRPCGKVGTGALWHERDGLHVEARLSGSSSEVEGIVARCRDQIMAGLSVGFLGGGRDDIWTAPATPGGVPGVRRRGAMLRELSLVVWPALTGAGVHRVTALTRTEAELTERLRREREEQHRRSEAFLAAHRQHAEIVEADPTPTVEAPPAAPSRPRPFQPDPVSGAPLLLDDPTDLERQLHQRALRNWANDVVVHRRF